MAWESTAKHLWAAMVILYIAAIIGGIALWHAYAEIQNSREQATYDACVDANARFRNFERGFDVEIAKLPPDQRQRARESKAANLRLVGTFVVVHRDKQGRSTCRQYARDRTR